MTTKKADQQMEANFRHKFQLWLNERPDETIGELREWMEEVHDQCLNLVWEGDPPIEEMEDIPCELTEYLNFWGNHEGEVFSFREVDIEEDITDLDEYIEELGKDTKLASFPVLKVA